MNAIPRMKWATAFTMTVLAAATLPTAGQAAAPLRVYVGTYTDSGSEGIYLCHLDSATGALDEPQLVGKMESPSFIAIHPNGRFLYAVGEVDDPKLKGGAVAAFAVDKATGRLEPLNQQASMGGGPCHLSVDGAGKNVLVANYGGGSVAVLPIEADGRLKPASSAIQHQGSSVDPERQDAPYAHAINLDAENRFAFVPDLGIDKVMIYRFDPTQGVLTRNDPPAAELAPGAGPRHIAFHPTGKLAFVINELDSTITTFRCDPARGALESTQTVSTLPNGADISNTTAEIAVHPSGKFVYGSNRGHDSIAIFAVDAEAGALQPLGHHPTGGRTPRSFAIDPSGAFMLAANQDSDTITVHRIDPKTGLLTATDHSARVAKPVCLLPIAAD